MGSREARDYIKDEKLFELDAINSTIASLIGLGVPPESYRHLEEQRKELEDLIAKN